MAPLITYIEAAFVKGRASWRTGDSVDTEPLLLAMEVYGMGGDDASEAANEAACTRAFLAMRRKWGNDWIWQDGDVAEAICRELLYHGEVIA